MHVFNSYSEAGWMELNLLDAAEGFRQGQRISGESRSTHSDVFQQAPTRSLSPKQPCFCNYPLNSSGKATGPNTIVIPLGFDTQ